MNAEKIKNRETCPALLCSNDSLDVRLTPCRDRQIGRACNLQSELDLACWLGARLPAKMRRFEDPSFSAGKERLVELHGCIKGLPVEGTNLCTDAPKGDGIEILRICEGKMYCQNQVSRKIKIPSNTTH